MFIDGDFKSNLGNCKYHCSPSCHPCQIGPEWVYGCTHKAWPQNRDGDFVPIVGCSGDLSKCDIRGEKFVGRYLGGLRRRLNNANKKAKMISEQIAEVEKLLDTTQNI